MKYYDICIRETILHRRLAIEAKKNLKQKFVPGLMIYK